MNDQLHEFENMIEQLKSSGVTLDENFLVANVIDKLPSLWSSYVNKISHIQEEFSFNYVLNYKNWKEK